MTALWTSADAAAATGGRAVGPDWSATGVSIDTRTLQPGDLFVALKDVRDGHEFVQGALALGAAAALVSRMPEGCPADAPLLVVSDVLEGLEALGIAARARTKAKVIGVTGSAGKTSTKEMLLTALQRQGAAHASVASYNNHWGVPLTLARMPVETDFAIIEIGMNHPGEIAPLAKLTRPDVALVTTVAAAHLEAFENIGAIAAEKAAIFQGLAPDGIAVLPGDLETSPILQTAAKAAGAKIVTFGENEGADYRIKAATQSTEGTAADAQFAGTPALFKIGAMGLHFVRNALAVFAAIDAVSGDTARAMCTLNGWTPPGGRGFRETVVLDSAIEGARLELIDDAFNANPASMDAALAVLAATIPSSGVSHRSQGRRIAVLGEMLELGPSEAALHAAIAAHPAMHAVDLVHCAGPRMRHLWQALPESKRGVFADDADDLAAQAARLTQAGDVVLVKGSKSSHVSKIVDAIRNLGHPPADT